MDGMANRMGMMVGGGESFFGSDWYHRIFLQYMKQKHKDLCYYQFSELSPLGTNGRQV